MSREALAEILRPLPWELRTEIDGYVRSVEFASPEIYQEAAVGTDEVPVDQFLFAAAVWRLWTRVESQHWILQSSLRLTSDQGAEGVRLGGESYWRGSEAEREVRSLREQLRRLLQEHDAGPLMMADGPRDVLLVLTERPVHGA